MDEFSADGHPLRNVRYAFSVDEKIYPILEWLWSHYFKTEYSCQGGLRPDEILEDENGDPLKDLAGNPVTIVYDAYILFYKGMEAAWFFRFLSSKGLYAEFSKREYSHGGGAAVRFNHADINAIIEELEEIPAFDYLREVIKC